MRLSIVNYPLFIYFLFSLCCQKTQAQNLNYSAENMESVLVNGEQVTQLSGNVKFTQPNRLLSSDFMWKYTNQKSMKFWGNMRLEDNDGMTITGDTLIINELTNIAIVTGNVILTDKNALLNTPVLTYDINSGLAEYTMGGTIVDEGNKLTSQYGRYNKNLKTMYFRNKVNLTGKEFSLSSDSLNYEMNSKMAFFFGKTKIVSKDGVIYSKKGTYNTTTKKGNLIGRSILESEIYLLEGDKIDFDRKEQKGQAHGEVVMFTKQDSATIYCEHAYFDDYLDYSKVYEKLLLKYPMKPDTLYLSADTLFTYNNRKPLLRKLLAQGNTKVFMNSLQGICDSLVYQFEDSSIYFYQNPVLWSQKNQILADSIKAQLANNEIDKLHLRQNSFIISKDSLENFNQIKGRRMIGFFKENQIKRLEVYGNAQSIYFALEEDTALLGMNKMLCTNMTAQFQEGSKLTSISSIIQPEGTFTPLHELLEPDKKLKGFVWKESERPTLTFVLLSRYRQVTDKQKVRNSFDERSISNSKKKSKPKKSSKKSKK